MFEQRDQSVVGTKIEPPYFFGVYEKFQQVEGDPFATEGWINHCREMIKRWNSPFWRLHLGFKNLAKKTLGIPVEYQEIIKHIKKLLTTRKTISILDIGGGFGDNFFYINRELGPISKNIKYTVVDNKVQCDFGVEFYQNRCQNITFKTDMPKEKFDIIIVIGTLQCIENWRDFISEITKLSNDSIFISRTPLNVSSSTFVTIQSICPAFGPSALKKIGEANINVISQSQLHLEFNKNNFICKSSILKSDYSKNFTRLPNDFRNIKYIDEHFTKI